MSLIFLESAEDKAAVYDLLEKKHNIGNFSIDDKIKEYGIENTLVLVYNLYKDMYGNRNIVANELIDAIEAKYIEFNNQPKKQRRIADAWLYNLIGITNKQYYDYLINRYSKMDFDNKIVPDQMALPLTEAVGSEIDYSNIQYTDNDIKKAIEWSKQSDMIIIIPCKSFNELERMWYNFNNMILKHRRESDWLSIHLFGLTNKQHYDYLKSQLNDTDSDLYPDIDEITESAPIHQYSQSRFFNEYLNRYYDAPIDEVVSIIENYTNRLTSSSELKIADKITNDVFTKRENSFEVSSAYTPVADLPFFTPEEMIDFGVYSDIDTDNYFGISADNNTLIDGSLTSDWYDKYALMYSGTIAENYASMTVSWLNTMRKLYLDFDEIKESGNQDTINARMQSILELGWNPYIDFNSNNRVSAKYRIESAMDDRANKYKFIDASSFISDDLITESDTATDEKIKPVFIVLVGSKTIFANSVKKFTKSKFSHAAISLDPKMESIYSFGIDQLDRDNGRFNTKGGLTKENIKRYKNDTDITIYGFFVKNKDFVNIKKNLDWFIDHSKETAYNYAGLLGYVFKIPSTDNFKFICSQFVDNLLKISNIDLTNGIKSSFISPEDLHKRIIGNAKIYQFFDDIAANFKSSALVNAIKRLKNKALPIKESSLLQMGISSSALILKEYNEINSGIEPIILEARVTPIDFDDNGNLLIRGDIFKIDFAAEYSKSHKILMAADSANSYETMKHELAKLWMMNTILEKKLHDKSIKSDKRLQLNTDRAHILNDFKKYIDVIMKVEPMFNFSKYYEDSQFNQATIKISKNMIKYTALTLKRLLTSDLTHLVPIQFIH